MIPKAAPGSALVYIVCVNKGYVMSLEDDLINMYNEVRDKGLQEKFDKQIAKMLKQDKHKHKTANERWDYALKRIQGWNPNKSEKKL